MKRSTMSGVMFFTIILLAGTVGISTDTYG
jgi:hypothetical protein